MYYEICLHHWFISLEVQVAEEGNSSFLLFCHALDLNIALILLLRHF